jgi:hypothetical protein
LKRFSTLFFGIFVALTRPAAADIASKTYVEGKTGVSDASKTNVGSIAVYAADGQNGQKIAAGNLTAGTGIGISSNSSGDIVISSSGAAYDAMTQTEIQNGSSTDSKVITPKVAADNFNSIPTNASATATTAPTDRAWIWIEL